MWRAANRVTHRQHYGGESPVNPARPTMAVFKDERKKTFLNPEGADKPLKSRAAVFESDADTLGALEAKAFARVATS